MQRTLIYIIRGLKTHRDVLQGGPKKISIVDQHCSSSTRDEYVKHTESIVDVAANEEGEAKVQDLTT